MVSWGKRECLVGLKSLMRGRQGLKSIESSIYTRLQEREQQAFRLTLSL
jgi:hypothetical protein